MSYKGFKHSEETKRKISLTRIGKPTTLGTKRPYSMGENNPATRIEVRIKISISKMGERNPNWKGGVSPVNVLIRNSAKARDWQKSVFKRDNYTCLECGARNGNGKNVVLNAHHIKPFALFPELRFEVGNGATLCVDCHKNTDSYGWKVYKPNQTKI